MSHLVAGRVAIVPQFRSPSTIAEGVPPSVTRSVIPLPLDGASYDDRTLRTTSTSRLQPAHIADYFWLARGVPEYGTVCRRSSSVHLIIGLAAALSQDSAPLRVKPGDLPPKTARLADRT
jgi:hypothetical protein